MDSAPEPILFAPAPMSASPAPAAPEARRLRDLTPQQWKSGIAAWLGWMFDGLELHLYTLVAGPVVLQLLLYTQDQAVVNEKKAYIQAAFLLGWAVGGAFFGRLGDKLGRSRALALTVLILWGYRMWWQRGRGSAFGRPIPRGAWQQVPPQILVPLAVAVAVVGYFVPLLGISLLAFLAVDIVLGEIDHRRGRTAESR